MESLKRALESIGRMWSTLAATQKVILSAAGAVMLILLVWGSVGSTEAWIRVAGAELDNDARSTILRKLQEKNQKHEIRGAEIFVPKQDADRIVTELAGDGSMKGNSVWKFLEQSDILATRWDKEKRYQIALQSRLEGMIRSIEGVRNASVVINPGSTNYQLGFAGPKPSASVQVELREGLNPLSGKNVQAIAGLVASAVQGVEISQVHIMDTRGTPYRVAAADNRSAIIADLYELQMKMETDILAKIKGAFAFSAASVIVGIEVKNSSSETDETKHGRAVPYDVQESNRVLKGGGGQTPTPFKGERGQDSVVEPSGRGGETTTDFTQKSHVDKKTIKEYNPAGQIQRVTIGVLIPVEEGPAFVDAEKLLPKLKEFVLKAAPQGKPEDVSVQLIPTKKPEAVVAVAESVRTMEWLYAHAAKLGLAVLVVVALLLVVRVLRGAGTQDSVEDLTAFSTALKETRDETPEGDVTRLKQGLQDMVGRNPQTVAASLKSFMSGR